MGLDEIIVRIRADIEGLEKGLSEANNKLKKFFDDAEKSTKGFKELGSKLTSVGESITVGLTAPITGFAAASVYAANKYDDALDNIRARTGATGTVLEDMGRVLRDSYVAGRQSMDDTANAMILFNQRLGAQGDSLRDLTTKAGLLSNMLGTNVVSTVDNTTKVFKAWGMSTAEASTYYDTLLKVAQSTGANIDELSNAVAGNSLMFKSMGYNVDQATLMVGNLMASGLSASDVITGMTQATNRLASEQQRAKTFLAGEAEERERLSSQLQVARTRLAELTRSHDANSSSVLEARNRVEELTAKLADLDAKHAESQSILGTTTSQYLAEYINKIKKARSETEANTLALEAFGPKGVGFAKVIRDGKLNVDELDAALKNNKDTVLSAGEATSGAAEKFDAMRKQLETSLIPLGLKLMEVFIQLEPVLSKIIGVVAGLASWFASLPAPVQDVILVVAGLAAAIGPLLIVMGQLISACVALAPIITAVGAALGGVALGPIVVVVAAIAGLVAAVWWLYNNCSQFKDLVDTLVSALAWNISATIDGIKTVFAILGDLLRGDYAAAWSDFAGFVTRTFESMPGPVRNVWNTILGVISGAVNTAIDIINGLIDAANRVPGVHIDHLGHVSLSLPGSSVNYTSQGTPTNTLEGVDKATLRHLGERAGGGPVEAGEAYVVGERGPELFVPSLSGVIIPNTATRRAVEVCLEDRIELVLDGDKVGEALVRRIIRDRGVRV